MKNKLFIGLMLIGFNTSRAQEVEVLTSSSSVRDKVVELNITFAPPPNAEVKKARKLLYSKVGRAVCSGVFISPWGHILTAKHCVQDSTNIDVLTYDGRIYNAKIRVQAEKADLAVIQIGHFGTSYFALAPIIREGEPICTLGSPLGLTRAVTKGVVSKILGDIMVLDCTAVPGNSGGPVLNSKNELVGIVSDMIIVFLGPAHLTVAQTVDSIRFLFYEIAGGK